MQEHQPFNGLAWNYFSCMTVILLDNVFKSCWLLNSPLVTATHQLWSAPVHEAIGRKDKIGCVTEIMKFLIRMDSEVEGPCFQKLDLEELNYEMRILRELAVMEERHAKSWIREYIGGSLDTLPLIVRQMLADRERYTIGREDPLREHRENDVLDDESESSDSETIEDSDDAVLYHEYDVSLILFLMENGIQSLLPSSNT